jgi:hypothetical protein
VLVVVDVGGGGVGGGCGGDGGGGGGGGGGIRGQRIPWNYLRRQTDIHQFQG